MDISQAR